MPLHPEPHRGLPRWRLALPAIALLLALAGCGEEPALAPGEERVGPDEASLAEGMKARILELGRRRAEEEGTIPRFNQPKTVACATGTFEIAPLEAGLARGLFAEPGHFEALVRFANASQRDDRDKDLRGLSLRLAGVAEAESADNPEGYQDFLFNTHPALFAGTPEAFHAFVEAVADERRWWYFLTHPRSLWIVLRARGQPESLLAERYWSTTPYRYGDDTTAVKYAMRACPGTRPVEVEGPDGDDPDYLRHALHARLAEGEACLTFMVQFQDDPGEMPIEDASVTWDEETSPFRPVAQLTLPRQPIAEPEALARCESLAFNPWNHHPAHRPLGGINRVRDAIYRAAGEQRLQHNTDTDPESGAP